MNLTKRVLPLMIGASASIGLSAHAATFTIADGDVTALKAAMTTAGTNGEDDVINLASGGLYALSSVDNVLSGNNGLPDIKNSGALVINGNGSTIERRFADGQTPVDFRLLYVRLNANATLNDLTLSNGRLATGGSSGVFGGGIFNRGNLTLNRSRITGCLAKTSSGAIESLFEASLTVTDSRFDNNSGEGAAVNSSSLASGTRPGSLTATNCIFEDNVGGGLAVGAGSGSVTDCIIRNNQGTFRAGGLAVVDSVATIRNCTITGNTTTLDEQTAGAGFLNFRGVTLLENCTISGNATLVNGAPNPQGAGGGVCNFDDGGEFGRGQLTISNCTISGNSAGLGGGVYQIGEGAMTVVGITIRNSTISGNNAANDGGGLLNSRGAIRIENSTITNNTAPNGAGVANAYGTTVKTTLTNTIVAGNTGKDVDQVANTETPAATEVSLQSEGYNLIGSGNATSVFAASGDQTGVSDPKLGPLQNNGGSTFTVAVLADSPALNRGNPLFDGTGKFDQRGPGFGRVKGGRIDIGAFESNFNNRAPKLNNATYTGSVGSSFSQPLAGSDADADTLTYSLATGSTLPTGLTLSGVGVISGTPTAAGRTDFSVTVTDGKDAVTAKFIIIVSAAGVDGVGPVLTSNAPLSSSYTRSGLASLIYTGTVRDVAQTATPVVAPVGVKQVLFQLRQGATAYSGNETTGFTSDLNRGYFPAFLGAPNPAGNAGTSTFRRNFASFIPSNLAVGSYSLVILGQDKNNNFSVEVVPVNITAATPPPAMSPFGTVGSANLG